MGALLDLAFAALDESETAPSKAELRRQRVLAMLNANSELEYALITDIDSDPRLNRTHGRPDYGAYNEAFVIQHWASFGPRF